MSFVGRDPEIAALEKVWSEACSGPACRAVLITAPAGAGKTRLANEFVRRIRERGEDATVLVEHGDSLAAQCALRPVLLVLEDLHEDDLPTVDFVAAAMRRLADRPLMVLALARPEIAGVFPGLWAEHAPLVIRLSSLPEADRMRGHQLEAERLESAGACDALSIAGHHRLGGRPDRAAAAYLQAAEQALAGNDLRAVVECVEMGIACGARGPLRGQLLLLEAGAYNGLAQLNDAERAATAARELFTPGSAPWIRAFEEQLLSVVRRPAPELPALISGLVETTPLPGTEATFAGALVRIAAAAIRCGHENSVAPLLARAASLERTGGG
jgi:hypothetical protein